MEGDIAAPLVRALKRLRLTELAGDLVPLVEWLVNAFVRKEPPNARVTPALSA